jgi:protocatechuate 3,4-dioxygenase beta subunit
MENNHDRRKFLRTGLAASAGALAMTSWLPKALAETCGGLTPPQTPGPFYPGEARFKPENDLTVVPGAPKRALGQVIYVKGRVIDPLCRPVAGANVEIWQACASGRYDNAKDDNPAPLDPNFRYWGETTTDADGAYIFKTIIPGAYPADTNWIRPPHIHFKVSKLGFHELVTQMYFAGNALNEKDLILGDIPRSDRARVVVAFSPAGPGLEPGSLEGSFEITLSRVRG